VYTVSFFACHALNFFFCHQGPWCASRTDQKGHSSVGEPQGCQSRRGTRDPERDGVRFRSNGQGCPRCGFREGHAGVEKWSSTLRESVVRVRECYICKRSNTEYFQMGFVYYPIYMGLTGYSRSDVIKGITSAKR